MCGCLAGFSRFFCNKSRKEPRKEPFLNQGEGFNLNDIEEKMTRVVSPKLITDLRKHHDNSSPAPGFDDMQRDNERANISWEIKRSQSVAHSERRSTELGSFWRGYGQRQQNNFQTILSKAMLAKIGEDYILSIKLSCTSVEHEYQEWRYAVTRLASSQDIEKSIELSYAFVVKRYNRNGVFGLALIKQSVAGEATLARATSRSRPSNANRSFSGFRPGGMG